MCCLPGSENTYGASTIYALVACNPCYHRVMWGYSIKDYGAFCKNYLASSFEGWGLDLACGSLAITAETYANILTRPVIFVDQADSPTLSKRNKNLIERNITHITRKWKFCYNNVGTGQSLEQSLFEYACCWIMRLISRSQDKLLKVFNDLEMEVTCEIKGNLAFIKYGY